MKHIIHINAHPQNPNIAAVLDAFAHAYDKDRKWIPIHTADYGTQKMCVTAVAYESGAPGMFLVSGVLRGSHLEAFVDGASPVSVNGFYNANDGSGVLTLK